MKTTHGQYGKINVEKQAAIAKYVLENGKKAAARYFCKKLDIAVKESSVLTCKKKYLAAHQLIKSKPGKSCEVKAVTAKKCGRPFLVGEKLDKEIQAK